jgi:ribosome-associated protein
VEPQVSGSAAGTPNNAQTADESLDAILAVLEDAKAVDIVTIPIAKKSALADYMVVASGGSHRHVGAITDRLSRAIKGTGIGRHNIQGLPHCDWVVVDTADVIVHIFRPEVREFYSLEKMWRVDAPKEPLNA